MTPPFISLVKAHIITVSWDSLDDHTATITVSGAGYYQPNDGPGSGNPVWFVQDATNPLKFSASYWERGFAPVQGDQWQVKATFKVPLDDTQLEHINVKVAVYGEVEKGEKELEFNSLFPGLGSTLGDSEGRPF